MSEYVAGAPATTASGLSQAHYDWVSTFCGVGVAAIVDATVKGAEAIGGFAADIVKKAAKAQETAQKVAAMPDADIAKLSTADKLALLKDIEGSGKPTGDVRKAQIKIFKNTTLDPKFQKEESDRADKVADAVKDDADVKAASNDWAGRPKEQKVKAMQRILEAQCKQLGLPVPPILPYDKAPDATGVEDGNYDPSDGKLHFNTNPGANKTFSDAMDTVVHEMSHAYQADLVKRVKSGALKPGDTDYEQAAMFVANDDADNYIQPDEDNDAYVAQPEENHARVVAADYIDKINKKLSGPPPATK
jgi:hypothetical protein